jgi:hypothetical protein
MIQSVAAEIDEVLGIYDPELEQMIIYYAQTHPISVEQSCCYIFELIRLGADVQKLKQAIKSERLP